MSVTRILHVAQSLDPADGGLPAVVGQLSEAQRATGAEVRVACVAGGPPGRPESVQLPSPSPMEWFCGRGPFSKSIWKEVSSADIVHLHGVWDVPLLAAARIARKLGKPYFVTPHGMLDPWSMSQKPWKKKIGLMLGFRKMLDGAAAIHWLNEDEHRLAKPLGIRPTPIVVPNGLPRLLLGRRADSGVFLQSRPWNARYVLFLSRLHPKKGLDILADAFAIVAKQSTEHLVVAGPDGGAEPAFRSRIAELGLQSRVDLVGPLYGDAKWAALDGAACFCLPSRQEGFSMAILEAMACRVPVVISEECHFPEVGQVGAGLVVPLNAVSVAEGIMKALTDSTSAVEMGRAGRTLVEERYTWDRIAKVMIDHYRRWITS